MEIEKFIEHAMKLKRMEVSVRQEMSDLSRLYLEENAPVKLDKDEHGNAIPKLCHVETYYTVTDYGKHELKLVKDEYDAHLYGYHLRSESGLMSLLEQKVRNELGMSDDEVSESDIEKYCELCPLFHPDRDGNPVMLSDVIFDNNYIRYLVIGEEDNVYEYRKDRDPRVRYNLDVIEEPKQKPENV